jgi:ribosomal protein S18 acetylase RimI-like enzyme
MQTGLIEIRLRAEQPEDDEFLYQLYASTRAEEMALTQWPEAQKEMFLRSQFHLQRAHYRRYYPAAAFCVIVQGAQLIGRFYVDRSTAEIRLMEISLIPQYRNRGLGTGLLNQLLQEAANHGKPLTLHVEKNNPAACWYERLGFQPVAERGPYLKMEWRPESGSATTLRPAERGGSQG